MALGYGLGGQSRFLSASSSRLASTKPTRAALKVGERNVLADLVDLVRAER